MGARTPSIEKDRGLGARPGLQEATRNQVRFGLLVGLVQDHHEARDDQEQDDRRHDVEAERFDHAQALAGVVTVVAGQRERGDDMSSIISVVPEARAPARRASWSTVQT